MSASSALMPANVLGWLDLRPLADSPVFNAAMTRYHEAGKPWHHALHDACASRAGWLALQQLPPAFSPLNQGASR